jgi:hypothetical protein
LRAKREAGERAREEMDKETEKDTRTEGQADLWVVLEPGQTDNLLARRVEDASRDDVVGIRINLRQSAHLEAGGQQLANVPEQPIGSAKRMKQEETLETREGSQRSAENEILRDSLDGLASELHDRLMLLRRALDLLPAVEELCRRMSE